ncbi:hypothetical protein ACWDUL_20790 [Nocardia niigatensis]
MCGTARRTIPHTVGANSCSELFCAAVCLQEHAPTLRDRGRNSMLDNNLLGRTWGTQGQLMYSWRSILGKPRSVISAALDISESRLQKYEYDERACGPDFRRRWCERMNAPAVVARKLELLAPWGILHPEAQLETPDLSSDDLDFLNEFTRPACYLTPNGQQILAVNSAMEQALPWLNPAPGDSINAATVVERLFLDPRAPRELANWSAVALWYAFEFEVMASGFLPCESYQQVRETYTGDPKFDAIAASTAADLDPHLSLTVTDPATGVAKQWTTRRHHPGLPAGAYDLISFRRALPLGGRRVTSEAAVAA